MAQLLIPAPAWVTISKDSKGDELHGLSTEECLEKTGLANWNVRAETLTKVNQYTIPEDLQNQQVLVRDVVEDGVLKSVQPIAYMGNAYTPVQNEDLFEYGDILLNSFEDAHWETMGVVGAKVYGIMKLPNANLKLDTNKGTVDEIDFYLTLASSFDGSMPVISFISPLRLACSNQLLFAVGNAEHSFKSKHTLLINNRIEKSKESIKEFDKYIKFIELVGNDLMSKPCDSEQFEEIYRELYPQPIVQTDIDAQTVQKYGAMGFTKWNNNYKTAIAIFEGKLAQDKQRTVVTDSFEEKPIGSTVSEIEGTMWSALNSLTEHLDWFANKSKKDWKKNLENQMFSSQRQVKRTNIAKSVLDYAQVDSELISMLK